MSDANMESETKMEVNNENEQPEFAKPSLTPVEIEKAEEAKLKAKYAFKSGPAIGGHSTFLQKKLAKGQKYFDSGDYQMAKQSHPCGPGGPVLGGGKQIFPGGGTNSLAPSSIGYGTGDAIPTPESVPARKTSIIQQKFTPLHTIPATPTAGICPPFVPAPSSAAGGHS